ncbi:MAG: tripartite tricarboxylate transporter TctB family protein [Thermodesulfobacteriota bacterium]
MRKSQLAFIVIFLCILAMLFYVTLDYPWRARNLPLLVIAVAMLILVRELLKEISRGKGAVAADANISLPERGQTEAESPLKYAVVFGWLSGLVLLIWIFGFLIAFPVYIFAYIKMNGEKWIWAFVVSVSFLIVVYFVFGVLLEIPLYGGLLFQ